MKITKYKTIAEQSARELDDEVNRLIASGFELYGSPYATGAGTDEPLVCQAMVKIQSVAEGSSASVGTQ